MSVLEIHPAASLAGRAAIVLALTAIVAPVSLTSASAAAGDRKPWQRTVESTCNGNQNGCSIKVFKVPATKRLEIRNVACELGVIDPDPVTDIHLYADDNNANTRFQSPFALVKMASFGGTAYYAFNTNTRLHAEAKDEIHVIFATTNDARSLNCNLAGELVTLP